MPVMNRTTGLGRRETVLMRAAAGSNWRGLAGMAPLAPVPLWPEGRGLMLARPLLGARREALRKMLRARGAEWIEDPANADPAFERVRARAALSALEAKGLVRTQSVKHHNRQRVICFTPAGRARYRSIRRLARVREQRLLEGLSDRQRADLLAALKIMLRNAAELVASEAASLGGSANPVGSRRPARAARRSKGADL